MANSNDTDRSRRKMASAAAPDFTAEEEVNLSTAAAFCTEWGNEPFDVERMVESYFTEDCIVRVLDSRMVAHGRRATIAMFSGWLEGGRRFHLKILHSTALGPVVVQVRADALSKGEITGKADQTAAVFLMSNGKIRELSDYFIQ